MFTECLSKDHKCMEATKGVCLKVPYESKVASYADHSQNFNDMLPTDRCRFHDFIPPAGAAGAQDKLSEVTVTGTLNLGALQTGMMIPLHASPITLELELVSTEAEVVQEGWLAVRNAAGNADLIPAQPRSAQREVESPRINCTLLTLSRSANQEFDKLLQTSGIMINAESDFTLQQSLTDRVISLRLQVEY